MEMEQQHYYTYRSLSLNHITNITTTTTIITKTVTSNIDMPVNVSEEFGTHSYKPRNCSKHTKKS